MLSKKIPKVNFHKSIDIIKTQNPYFLVCDATLPWLLLSPLDFPEFSFGYAYPLGLITLITWQQSSLKYIREDMDLSEPLEGEEGETMSFPLSRAWWASFFNLLLAWVDFTGEWSGTTWAMVLTDGGEGKDKLRQPRYWETVGWRISCHHSFSGTLGYYEAWGGTRILGTCGIGKEAFYTYVGLFLSQSNWRIRHETIVQALVNQGQNYG